MDDWLRGVNLGNPSLEAEGRIVTCAACNNSSSLVGIR